MCPTSSKKRMKMENSHSKYNFRVWILEIHIFIIQYIRLIASEVTIHTQYLQCSFLEYTDWHFILFYFDIVSSFALVSFPTQNKTNINWGWRIKTENYKYMETLKTLNILICSMLLNSCAVDRECDNRKSHIKPMNIVFQPFFLFFIFSSLTHIWITPHAYFTSLFVT